jgi:hypothetical protein
MADFSILELKILLKINANYCCKLTFATIAEQINSTLVNQLNE